MATASNLPATGVQPVPALEPITPNLAPGVGRTPDKTDAISQKAGAVRSRRLNRRLEDDEEQALEQELLLQADPQAPQLDEVHAQAQQTLESFQALMGSDADAVLSASADPASAAGACRGQLHRSSGHRRKYGLWRNNSCDQRQ